MASDADLFCPACGYNLRGIESTQCPECGATYAREELSASRIPWTSRGRIGYLKATVKTIWVATAHPARIGQSLQAELTLREARVYWAFVLLPAGAVVILCTAALYGLLRPTALKLPRSEVVVDLVYPLERAYQAWPVATVVAVGVTLALMRIPARVALFGRYPEPLRERIVAGSYYLAGAWVGGAVAGVLVALLFTAGLLALSPPFPPPAADWIRLLSVTGIFVPVTAVLVWLNAWRTYRQAAGGLSGRRPMATVLIAAPLLLACVLFWLVLFPWCIGLLLLMAGVLG